jgi:hypothetical protein
LAFHRSIGVIIDGQWRPEIGGPTLLIRGIVIAYLTATLAR